MIIVTGGGGFIGSALIWKLNSMGYQDILVVDRLGHGIKWENLARRSINRVIHKDDLWQWFEQESESAAIEAVFHMGACSSTDETDVDYLMKNNVNYSIALFNFCVNRQIPFIYASSAATYGGGECGFSDDPGLIPKCCPPIKFGQLW